MDGVTRKKGVNASDPVEGGAGVFFLKPEIQGGDGMQNAHYPQMFEKFEIQAYKKPSDLGRLKKTHVPFTGSPGKHPYAPDKAILVVDPCSTNTFYYEFEKEDISYAEELPNMVNLEGEALIMARIWVKKRSIAMRCSPFIVDDTNMAMANRPKK